MIGVVSKTWNDKSTILFRRVDQRNYCLNLNMHQELDVLDVRAVTLIIHPIMLIV